MEKINKTMLILVIANLQTFTNPFPNIKIKSLSTKEVENIVKSLNSKNSYGYDEISTKVLRMSSPLLALL
jgi:hypothetical protein